ncbi:hypothetical protein J6590_058740 [Homalodisca vitripennis]|nr:hypothetical protein J6590_058740 [Homalodisca vitripennis]
MGGNTVVQHVRNALPSESVLQCRCSASGVTFSTRPTTQRYRPIPVHDITQPAWLAHKSRSRSHPHVFYTAVLLHGCSLPVSKYGRSASGWQKIQCIVFGLELTAVRINSPRPQAQDRTSLNVSWIFLQKATSSRAVRSVKEECGNTRMYRIPLDPRLRTGRL